MMFKWLTAMCHLDGDISFFNDAAFGIALTPLQLRACAKALGLDAGAPPEEGVVHLEPSGYVRIRRGPLLVIFDAAPVGPDYNPGHAHADTLSFELSWGTQRVLTNSGISTYSVGPRRTWERSTAAHNAVEIDAKDSSEVWSAFRVARRARPLDPETGQTGAVLRAACSHDGYRRLRGAPMHRRAIEAGANALQVSDTVLGAGIHRAAGYFHVHPGVGLEEGTAGGWTILLPQGGRLRVAGRNGLRLRREEGTYSPEFGKSIPRPVLVWRVEGRLPIGAEVDVFEERTAS
jgi:uncharacterized heparinase superfamily protein